MSASQSPDKPGRRNMGVILGTDDVAKNIPKTMGAMQFDSKTRSGIKLTPTADIFGTVGIVKETIPTIATAQVKDCKRGRTTSIIHQAI